MRIEALSKEKDKVETQLLELKSDYEELGKQLGTSENNNSVLKSKVTSLQRELDLLTKNNEKSNEEQRLTMDHGNLLKRQISELEKENLELRNEREDLKVSEN